MSTLTTVQLSPELRDYYDRTFIQRAIPLAVHAKWAQKRPIPKNSGKVIRFRKYHSLPLALNPLTEAITPVGGSMEFSDITATLSQYGYWLAFSDVVQFTHPDAVLTEATELLGEQSGLTFDTLMRDIMHGGTNVVYAGNVAGRSNVAAKVTTTDLDKIILKLKRENVRPITKLIQGTVKVGTKPIPPAYFAICSPEMTRDLSGLAGWKNIEEYANQTEVVPGEVGSYKGIRFVETTNAKVFEGAGSSVTTGMESSGSKCNVHSTLVFGADAYGECPLSGTSAGILLKSHATNDTSDTSDPLNQRSTIGWKALWTALILQDKWMVRYECTVAE